MRSRWTTTSSYTRRAPTCCAASAAPDEARAVYERARSSSACDQLERRFLERRLEAL
jgi:hypothetical protein